MDSDWLPSRKLNLSEAASFALLVAVGRDAKFLRDVGLMDYSLLLGIHIVQEQRPSDTRERQEKPPHMIAAHSFEGPGAYVMGIIDVLQYWTLRKRAERFFKILLKCRCAADLRNGMSAIEPYAYAKRFHDAFGTEQLHMSVEDVKAAWEEMEQRGGGGFDAEDPAMRNSQP